MNQYVHINYIAFVIQPVLPVLLMLYQAGLRRFAVVGAASALNAPSQLCTLIKFMLTIVKWLY